MLKKYIPLFIACLTFGITAYSAGGLDEKTKTDQGALAQHFTGNRHDIDYLRTIAGNLQPAQLAKLILALDENFAAELADEPIVMKLIDSASDVNIGSICSAAIIRIGRPASKYLAKRTSYAAFSVIPYDENFQKKREVSYRLLTEIADPEYLQLFIESLKDENPYVRVLGTNVLLKIKVPEGFSPLIEALGDKDPDVRNGASKALFSIGRPAVAPLINALRHKNPTVRLNAVKLLGDLGDERAIEFLANSFEDREQKIYLESAVSLVKIGKPAVEPLVKLLGDNRILTRIIAKRALAIIGEISVGPLKESAKDPNPVVRQMAIETLGEIGDARAIPVVEAALNDSERTVRKSAVKALRNLRAGGKYFLTANDIARETTSNRIKPPKTNTQVNAPQALAKLLRDADPDIRWEAVQTLSKTRDPKMVEPIMELLSDDFFLVREEASRTLAKIGEPALKPLIDKLSDKKSRREAQKTLILIGKTAVPELLSSAAGNSKSREICIETIGLIGDGASCPGLMPFLKNKKTANVASVALARIGEPAVPFLLKALHDRDEAVRLAALDSLGRIAPEKVVGQLEKERDAEPEVFGFITAAAGNLKEKHEIRQKIKHMFGINVEENPEAIFTVEQLKTVYSVLSNMPAHIVTEILTIKTSFPIYHYSGTYAESIIELNPSKPIEASTVSHEIGHFIDAKYHHWKAFEELFKRSAHPDDFASPECRENSFEDFAVTFESYTDDSKKEFLKAINRARKGRDIYLAKLLFIADALSMGNPGTTYIYKLDEDAPRYRKKAPLVRDESGRIVSVDGTAVYGSGGKYDLEGLYGYFSGLK
ncbi:MAG: HEAT repeat domain-containing protein [Endomicrobiales bacterium]|nr:HEAT repeat domain-containing protein [Endomicrobiales bacterium]